MSGNLGKARLLALVAPELGLTGTLEGRFTAAGDPAARGVQIYECRATQVAGADAREARQIERVGRDERHECVLDRHDALHHHDALDHHASRRRVRRCVGERGVAQAEHAGGEHLVAASRKVPGELQRLWRDASAGQEGEDLGEPRSLAGARRVRTDAAIAQRRKPREGRHRLAARLGCGLAIVGLTVVGLGLDRRAAVGLGLGLVRGDLSVLVALAHLREREPSAAAERERPGHERARSDDVLRKPARHARDTSACLARRSRRSAPPTSP